MINRFWTQRSKKLRTEEPDDPQAHLIYTVERRLIGNSVYAIVPKENLVELAKYASKLLRLPTPGINILTERQGITCRTMAWQTGSAIYLNPYFHGQNASTLLHELAHYFVEELYYDISYEDHGPEFVGVYRYLLDRFNVLPCVAFDVLLKEGGVKFKRYSSEEELRNALRKST